MGNIVDTIVEGIMGKKKKASEEVAVENMTDPITNPDRPLKLGEIHKIGRAAKPR